MPAARRPTIPTQTLAQIQDDKSRHPARPTGHWPTLLLAGAALGAGLQTGASTAALACLLAAAALLARQAWELRRRQRQLELIGELLHCINPHLGLQHSLQRMQELTRQFFGASCCSLELPGSGGQPTCPGTQPDTLQRIRVALPWQQAHAQLILAGERAWRRRDRQLLEEIAKQAYARLERIEQIDRLCAQAAERERERLGLDLHDRVIQPYIGLKLALEALHTQARQGKAVEPGLRSVLAMTTEVIKDLRTQMRRIDTDRPERAQPATELVRQARRMGRQAGLQVSVRGAGPLAISQRLRQELSELIREGLSNIRRHTRARKGEIELHSDGRWLGLRIANEGLPARADFAPRSISLRAQALGGWAQVHTEAGGRTSVHVHIPL